MEPQSSLVLPTEDGGVEIISATQHPSGIQVLQSSRLKVHFCTCPGLKKEKKLDGGVLYFRWRHPACWAFPATALFVE